MRTLLLVALLVIGPGTAMAKEPVLPTSVLPIPDTWLVLPAVDRGGRRPVPVSTVFARYLLDPRAKSPKEGESITGERGEAAAWRASALDAKGRPDLSGGARVDWAFFSVRAPRAGVWMLHARHATRAYINGTPFMGDVYGMGFGVPVALDAGPNHIYLTGLRRGLHVAFTEPPSAQFVSPRGQVVPDVPIGQGFSEWAGVRLVNASVTSVSPVVRLRRNEVVEPTASPMQSVCPLGMVQVPLRVTATGRGRAAPHKVELPLQVLVGTNRPVATGALRVPLQVPEKCWLRTFQSGMDGSVQPYGLRRPSDPTAKDKGLVLSLHGAGVNPRNQVGAYSDKPDFWIAVPTNRGAYGFDWQDWGRLDAYEVLEHLIKETGVSRDRVYLTGHSMGGHGTWHLAANDPDRFAAIAPSAGWVSFDSYGGRPDGALRTWWRAADRASQTLDLIQNLAPLPTYVLHGDADKTVPVTEAQTMLAALRQAGADPAHHFEPGKGHWWNGKRAQGADCVDWPEIFALFREQRRQVPAHFRWTSVDAATDATHHWITLWQAATYGVPMTVEATYDKADRSAEIQTTNVRCLALHPTSGLSHLRIDGAVLPAPSTGRLWLSRSDAGWRVLTRAPVLSEKHPTRQGPLRRGMQRRFVFVYGTAGRNDENTALLARARLDAQTWLYRGNGHGLVVSDAEVLANASAYAGRDLVLYGNSETNGAWDRMVPPQCPVRVRRGRITIGDEDWRGADLGAAFVYPRQGTERAHVVCFADTGVPGTRVGMTLRTFVSGAGFPDYLVYGAGILTRGDGGVLATGWFNAKWQVQKGGYVARGNPK